MKAYRAPLASIKKNIKGQWEKAVKGTAKRILIKRLEINFVGNQLFNTTEENTKRFGSLKVGLKHKKALHCFSFPFGHQKSENRHINSMGFWQPNPNPFRLMSCSMFMIVLTASSFSLSFIFFVSLA